MGAELIGTFFVTLVATGVDVLYYTGSGHVTALSFAEPNKGEREAAQGK